MYVLYTYVCVNVHVLNVLTNAWHKALQGLKQSNKNK
jgi:hypothetical protein